MTNPSVNPNYSGVTIQISNPAVYAGTLPPYNNSYPELQGGGVPVRTPQNISNIETNTEEKADSRYGIAQSPAISYPPQYYLNNYNYQNNYADGTKDDLRGNNGHMEQYAASNQGAEFNTFPKTYSEQIGAEQTEDLTKSTSIINELNEREAKIQEEKKNGKQKRVIALTDEYIKSLENYLNNPNDEIRLMASKEILTRLDEDKDRFNDAALNALLNKMLQDPSKIVRISALSAFSSQLASGNDYTVKLLQNIQANPNADKEDVLQSADILLKMSAGTEIRMINKGKNQEQ